MLTARWNSKSTTRWASRSFAQMEAMKKMAEKNPNAKLQSQGLDLLFDEASVKAAFEKKEGIKVKSVKAETKTAGSTSYADLHCDDLGKAAAADPMNQKSGDLSLVKNADGNWVLEAIGKADSEKKPTPEEQAMIKAMMAGPEYLH